MHGQGLGVELSVHRRSGPAVGSCVPYVSGLEGGEVLMGQSEHRHVALLVEIPAIYTDDLESLREYQGEYESESDWLLGCIRLTNPVRLRAEVDGEKDSEVVEVWGSIREARLVEPGRGYDLGEPHLTDDQLRKHGEHKLLRDERACEWCMTDGEALRAAWEDEDA